MKPKPKYTSEKEGGKKWAVTYFVLCIFTLLSILSLVKEAQPLLEMPSNLEGFKYGLQSAAHMEHLQEQYLIHNPFPQRFTQTF